MALKAIRITMFHGIVYPGKGSELSCAREKVRLCPQMVLSQQVIPYLLMCLRIERESAFMAADGFQSIRALHIMDLCISG